MSTLPDLFERLSSCSEQIALQTLLDELEQVEIDWTFIEPHLRFQPESYQRNLLFGNDNFHALLLCWKSGQRSPIHDHRHSNCGVRILRGTATESTFLMTDNGLVYPTGSRTLNENSICASADSDIHQVSNLHATNDLVTLHIYSPPLMVMGKYSLTTSKVTDFVDPVFEYCSGGGI